MAIVPAKAAKKKLPNPATNFAVALKLTKDNYKIGEIVEVYSAKDDKGSIHPNKAWRKALIKNMDSKGIIVVYLSELGNPSPVIGAFSNPINVRKIRSISPVNAPRAPKAISDWPGTCPKCAGPAYVGAFMVDCKNKCDSKE